jgi:Fur family transcriptional regulator, peroxide stress response regulator
MKIELFEDFFRSKCAKHGLKVTPQRIAIYNELVKSKDHPTAEKIYKKVKPLLPNISFDTVYRTLLSFSEAGIINLVEGYGEVKRFEPNLHQHHHFRCIKCHKIIDFLDDEYNSLSIPDMIQKQCTILNKRVVLEGLCGACSKQR